MTRHAIRQYRDADAAAVLAINAANVPDVGPMDAGKLATFVALAPFLKVLEVDGVVAGMLVGLTESETFYMSPNYQWFRARYPVFAYVDRIALDAAARGHGFGPEFYRAFEEWARACGKAVICAEVNTVPANPRSLRFHELFGFAEVARFQPYTPSEEVAMLVKEL